ncbi:hypothetical protein [Lysinibacillus xylanilyticus]|uniref:hypothetical protein n=1 Tax=Lysinibacillus xylanilyticus TaxID=582475 RepID=UPI00083CA273|nr:hypothetical protein [Lysinibacillus xylanilyticus]
MNLKHQLFKIFFTFEVKEAHYQLSFIGLSFVILGIIHSFDIVTLSQMTIIGLTISGIFFVLGDFCQHFIDNYAYNPKKVIAYKDCTRIQNRWKVCKFFCLLIAILSLIIAPYIKLNVSVDKLEVLSTSLSLVAIGLTILNVSLYNNRKLESLYEDLADSYAESLKLKAELIDLKADTSLEENDSKNILESDNNTSPPHERGNI